MFCKTRVAVLRGGPSSEYHVSLKTGAMVLANLPEQYHPIDVLIDLDGAWHYNGKKERHHNILDKVDVVWNALHGEFGEDGAVQHLLESHGVRFSGSKRLGSGFSFNKFLARQVAERGGIKTPHALVFRREDVQRYEVLAGELYRTFPQPCIVKPVSKGSSIGISVAHTPEEIAAALATAFSVSERILVEEFIEGREAVCGVVEGFRGSPFYSLLPVEVALPEGHRFFNFETRYGEALNHRCPGSFSTEEKEELQHLAQEIHRLLGLRHYSRSEFIVHPKRGIFFIEADALPDLHENVSPYLQSLNAVGASLPEFLQHILTLTLSKR
ncbi:MAG: D-alanine-D-alanine ligase [Parcubacteria group bacterium GW2011_GWA2_49_9]|nr:MAG: D-alanine-D-alanine ligase [Parcubacteria group bacterium GW2011_GWA2_49_9]